MEKLNEAYWDDRYQQNNTGWDIGYASPAIVNYVNQLVDKDIAILIPGCGFGHEAEYLLKNGFTNVSVLDFAPTATASLSSRLSAYANKGLNVITGDFFTHAGTYDLVLEQTFFCALNPLLRSAYVQTIANLLKPNGKLVGLLFNRSFDVSPPFGGSEAEYRALFENKFKLKVIEPCVNSIPQRAGAELFINFQLR